MFKRASLVNDSGAAFDALEGENLTLDEIKRWARGRGGKYGLVILHYGARDIDGNPMPSLRETFTVSGLRVLKLTEEAI